jgi:hypothetical protein
VGSDFGVLSGNKEFLKFINKFFWVDGLEDLGYFGGDKEEDT